MSHELTVTIDEDDDSATGVCSCGRPFGPCYSGSATVTGRTAQDRIPKAWTAESAVRAAHRCHVAWRTSATGRLVPA